jgi:integrase
VRAIISAKLLASKAAQPSAKPFEIRDKRLPGFVLRVQPSGYRSYYAEYGRAQRKRLGAVGHLTPDEARERCEKVLGNVAHDRALLDGLDGNAEAITLGQHIGKEDDAAESLATYRQWLRANHPKSAARTLQRLQTCFGKWYTRPLTEITVERIESWRTARLIAGKSPTTVLRDVMALSGALRHAVKAKKLPTNPVRDVEKPRIDRNPKARFLDPAEEQRLRAALRERDEQIRKERESANQWRRARKQAPLPPLPHYGDHLTPAVLLTMNSGLRRGELLALRWSAVDLKGKQITIEARTSKSGQTTHVPLNSEALDVLKNWHEQTPDAERVFAVETGFKTAWAALLTRAKITGFRWHDLRHHFASRLVQVGVPLNTVRALLGHGSITTTLRYAHLSASETSEAVARLVQP